MKKILSLVMVIAMLAVMAITTSAADIPTDGLIANFKFDMTWENSVDGTSGEPITTQFGEALYEDVMDPDRYWFTGVEGQAFWCADGDGFNTLVNPGTNDWTIGLWVIEPAHAGITPYMWYGQRTQSPENWISLWNVCIENSAGAWDQLGLAVGSNDSAGARLGLVPEVAAKYDAEAEVELQWTHVVLSAVLDAEANTYTLTMYVNGENVRSASGFPNPDTGDAETNGDYIYLNGINAWADAMSKGAIDEVVVYNRALADDEVASLYGAYAAPATYETLDDFNAAQVIRDGSAEETDAPETEAPETEAPETEAPADDTTADPADDTTAAPAEEGGCGSSMGAAALVVALVSTLGCAIVKKH